MKKRLNSHLRSVSAVLIITCCLLFSKSAICQSINDIEDAESQRQTWMLIGGIGVAIAIVAGIIAIANKSSDEEEVTKKEKKSTKSDTVKDSTSVIKSDSLATKKKDSGK